MLKVKKTHKKHIQDLYDREGHSWDETFNDWQVLTLDSYNREPAVLVHYMALIDKPSITI